MNWIILLLLFGCSGNGNSGRCGNNCGCRRNTSERNSRECACAREAVREAKEDVREALRDVREARERQQAVCDGPGMVPPTWQDYPPVSRNDRDKDCGCDN